jgi:hypothetical protein
MISIYGAFIGFSATEYLYFGLKDMTKNGDEIHDPIISLYFSVVTLTTVGYGDFVPSGNYSRLVAAWGSVEWIRYDGAPDRGAYFCIPTQFSIARRRRRAVMGIGRWCRIKLVRAVRKQPQTIALLSLAHFDYECAAVSQFVSQFVSHFRLHPFALAVNLQDAPDTSAKVIRARTRSSFP